MPSQSSERERELSCHPACVYTNTLSLYISLALHISPDVIHPKRAYRMLSGLFNQLLTLCLPPVVMVLHWAQLSKGPGSVVWGEAGSETRWRVVFKQAVLGCCFPSTKLTAVGQSLQREPSSGLLF